MNTENHHPDDQSVPPTREDEILSPQPNRKIAPSDGDDENGTLAIYNKMEVSDPQKAWDTWIEPKEFFEDHNLVENEQFGARRAIWRTWFSPVFFIIVACLTTIVIPKSNLWPFLKSIIAGKNIDPETNISEKPKILESKYIPKGLKDAINKINEGITDEKWASVLKGAKDLKMNHLPEMKRKQESCRWLYECLVASRVLERQAKQYTGIYEDAVRDAETYREMEQLPSFKIDYNAILARYYLQGGNLLKPGDEAADRQILKEIARLHDQFGVEVTGDDDQAKMRAAKLRKIKAYTIIRLLQPKTDSKEMNKFDYPKMWTELDDILREWRGPFPQGNNAQEVEDAWRNKPRDLLICEQWFWRKLDGFEPFLGVEVQIGDRKYNGNDAGWNADRIDNALKSK